MIKRQLMPFLLLIMDKNKRGQAAAGAAILLVIIAALLVGFVVLIPPQERAELLGESSTSTSTTHKVIDEAAVKINLLKVSPGKIDFLNQKEIEHPLPVTTIFTKTESKILAEKNVVSMKKGAFSEEQSNFKFTVPSLDQSDDFLFSFTVKSAQGDLLISLNGEEIFSSEVAGGESLVVNLPKNSIQENNELLFSTSGVGAAFWKTNSIQLEKLKVVSDVTDLESQASKNLFLVSETEKKNLEKIRLKFKPDCDTNKAGKLEVLINGNEIYSAIPDCELSMVPLEFSPSLVYSGENEIVFLTSKGTYVISNIKIESELKEVEYPTYYFEVSHEQYQDVVDEKLRLRTTLNFVDVVSSKYGELIFNGHAKNFDTKEVTYTLDLSDDIVQGNNALKVKPDKTIEVQELRVDLVK